MKVYLVISLLIAVTSAEYVYKYRKDQEQFLKECVAELDIPESLVEKYKVRVYPEDDVTKCYIKCLFEKYDFFDASTGLKVDNMRQELAGPDIPIYMDHPTSVLLQECVDNNEQGSNACEWVARQRKCIHERYLKQDYFP